MQRWCGRACLLLCVTVLAVLRAQPSQQVLNAADVVALDGHSVSLPRDLSPVTVVIVGFSKASADATTAWEIPVRTKLAGNTVNLYDVAVLASVPGFMHSWVLHALRGKVPPVLQPRFLPVFTDEAGWKQVCDYDSHAPDAAYVLIVDREMRVLWRTHESYSDSLFAELHEQTRRASRL